MESELYSEYDDNVTPAYEGEADDTVPCTCTLACIPAGITDEQHCREEASARGVH